MRELLGEIGSTLRTNKLRTALTGFAVSWGIFLLICLLGTGNGLMNSFMGNMEEFVNQSVWVSSGQTSLPANGYKEGRRIEMDEQDVAITAGPEFSAHVDEVAPMTPSVQVTLSSGKNTVSGSLTGATPAYLRTNKLQLTAGRFFNPTDETERRKVLVIDDASAREIRPREPEGILGSWIQAGEVMYRIVGIYRSDEMSYGHEYFIPYATAKAIYSPGDKIDMLVFTFHGLETLEENEAFEKRYGTRLRTRHEAHPDDRNAIWIWNRYTGNLEMAKGQHILRIALWILGLLTLVSGIVGVSNIMLITVKERTHEFGIRKAIGARPGHILSLIITESVTITALFGYVGMFLGMVACEIIGRTVGARTVDIGFTSLQMLVEPKVGLDVALEATLLLILAGTLAGAAPALKAAKVRPIEALRAE